MATEFEGDMAAACGQLDEARRALIDAVSSLSDADLEKGRRGGWTVRRVLEHVIWSESLYGRLLRHLRGEQVEGEIPPCTPESVEDARARLEASRAALLAALEGVDEESFYKLQTIGHEEYSVLSLLENTAMHDNEHAAQVRELA
jgi:uncharacterized protein (TIGR03083 family)